MSFDPMVLSAGGRVALLEQTRTYRNRLLLRLYQNDLTPDRDTAISDIVECDFPGYAAVEVTTFGLAGLNPAGFGESVAFPVTFTRATSGTPQDAYGFYWTDRSDNLIATARRTEGPFVFALAGDELAILPRWADGDSTDPPI